ncbi:outer membrane beta-barrel protein, partial [Bacteroidota bacterium]
MKRAIPVILLALLFGIPVVHGQFVESMGLKAGISLANQSHKFTPIDYTLETKPLIGPAIAFFVEPFRGEHLSLQLDLAFAAKGSKSTTQSITVNHLNNDQIIINEGDLKVSKFYYLSFAPMARYRIGEGPLSPYGLLGPRLDLLLKYTTDSDYPLEQQNNMILGLNVGAGVEYS